ncbi:MAG TPA: hypothetical protein VER96_26940 [Polyangiaceae bacterium]|nr:hypothetical protein [Polyangiaceae bacterium]
MMGREKRAQLLVPSFVFAAATAVAACAGTVVGEEPETAGAAGSMNPLPVSGGGYIATNPPPVSAGGYIATNPPPIGWSGGGSRGFDDSGGYGSEAGDFFVTDPPAVVPCPKRVPQNGTACIPPAAGGHAQCVYEPNDPCITTFAMCTDGLWELAGYAIDCSGWGGAGGVGGGPPIAEAGAAGEGWSEPDPAVYCPSTLPKSGAYCYKPSSVTSYRCDYPIGCGSYEATCVGQWKLAVHDSASCAAGSPGI